MIKSCVRLISFGFRRVNIIPQRRLYKYRFSTSSEHLQFQKKQDRNSLVEKIKDLHDKKNPSRIQDLQMLLLQIKPYFYELDSQEYKVVVGVLLESGLFDQSTLIKIVERGYYFFDMKQLSIENLLQILNSILTPQTKLDQDHLRIIVGILENMNYDNINGSDLSYCIAVYGKLKAFLSVDNQKLQNKLINTFNLRYGYIQSKDIGLAAMSLAIIQAEGEQVWQNVEDRTLQLLDEIPFQELINSATALAMHSHGTKYFWKQFCDTVISKLNQMRTDEITQTLLLLCQVTPKQQKYNQAKKDYEELYICLEQAFLTRYQEFDIYNSVLAFSCFGKLKRGTEIWSLFEVDLANFIQESTINEMIFMIPNVMNMGVKLSTESKNILKQYVIANGQDFHDELKDQLTEQFTNEGLFDEQLEKVLDRNRLWNL